MPRALWENITDMSIVTRQIRNEKEYKSIISNLEIQMFTERPHPLSVTGLSEGAAEAFYAELIGDIAAKGADKVLLLCPDEKTETRLNNVLLSNE